MTRRPTRHEIDRRLGGLEDEIPAALGINQPSDMLMGVTATFVTYEHDGDRDPADSSATFVTYDADGNRVGEGATDR